MATLGNADYLLSPHWMCMYLLNLTDGCASYSGLLWMHERQIMLYATSIRFCVLWMVYASSSSSYICALCVSVCLIRQSLADNRVVRVCFCWFYIMPIARGVRQAVRSLARIHNDHTARHPTLHYITMNVSRANECTCVRTAAVCVDDHHYNLLSVKSGTYVGIIR